MYYVDVERIELSYRVPFYSLTSVSINANFVTES